MFDAVTTDLILVAVLIFDIFFFFRAFVEDISKKVEIKYRQLSSGAK